MARNISEYVVLGEAEGLRLQANPAAFPHLIEERLTIAAVMPTVALTHDVVT